MQEANCLKRFSLLLSLLVHTQIHFRLSPRCCHMRNGRFMEIYHYYFHPSFLNVFEIFHEINQSKITAYLTIITIFNKFHWTKKNACKTIVFCIGIHLESTMRQVHHRILYYYHFVKAFSMSCLNVEIPNFRKSINLLRYFFHYNR